MNITYGFCLICCEHDILENKICPLCSLIRKNNVCLLCYNIYTNLSDTEICLSCYVEQSKEKCFKCNNKHLLNNGLCLLCDNENHNKIILDEILLHENFQLLKYIMKINLSKNKVYNHQPIKK